MISKNSINIFSDEAVIVGMLSRLSDRTAIEEYYLSAYHPSPVTVVKSTLPAGDTPLLGIKPENDASSAIELHKFLGDIGRTFATDPRLWTYLTHITFRSYVQDRWELPPLDDLRSENKAKDLIVERWFFHRSKAIAHNAIARLWWAGFLTYAPWLSMPSLKVLQHDDPYVYTKILFSSQDVHTSLIEREIFSSSILLFAVLEFLRLNPDYSSKKKIQDLSKELNLISGVKKMNTLSIQQAIEVVSLTAAEIRGET